MPITRLFKIITVHKLFGFVNCWIRQSRKKRFSIIATILMKLIFGKIVSDRRALAAIDAYRATLTLWRLKTLLYGDANAHPRDLSFDAFRRPGHAVFRKL
jgi:hypothetical protein